MAALIARGVQLLIALGVAYFLALWFALIVWTFQDIQSRSRSVIAQIFSTLVVVLFSFPGVILYLILRPRDTLDDAFQRSLEEEYLLQDLEELPLCPTCQHYVEQDYVFCPHCRTELKEPCAGCGRPIDIRWEICPFCGEEQFEEELPAARLAEEWEPAEVDPVTRLLGQARERLSGRRTRELGEGVGADERGMAELQQGGQSYLPWESEAPTVDTWARRPEPNALRGEREPRWGDDGAGPGEGDTYDPTEEIPIAPPPRP
ncbi:MAG TPA: zinc ribbon domain-containing protein [Nitrolancea sp.]|nr:zinc ribbon domain-containing protein [Nitrolancea sp.]